MSIESYSLIFMDHTEKAVCFIGGADHGFIWLPKSQIEVDGVSHEEDFDNLVRREQVDVYVPDWLAEDKGLL